MLIVGVWVHLQNPLNLHLTNKQNKGLIQNQIMLYLYYIFCNQKNIYCNNYVFPTIL